MTCPIFESKGILNSNNTFLSVELLKKVDKALEKAIVAEIATDVVEDFKNNPECKFYIDILKIGRKYYNY